MAVFKAYDIRGTVPDQLNPPLAYQVGFATARLLSGGRSVGGRLQPEGARPGRPPGWAGAGRLALCRAAHVPRGL